jgi:hypothetical protein
MYEGISMILLSAKAALLLTEFINRKSTMPQESG